MRYKFMTVQGEKKLLTNAYIKVEPIRGQAALTGLFDHEPVHTNIADTASFLDRLVQFEAQARSSCKKEDIQVNSRYGVLLTFMLDHKRSNKELRGITEAIVKRFRHQRRVLPFFSWVKRKHKGYYLAIYICERLDFGCPTTVYRQKAVVWCYDRTTGKRCRPDNENAVRCSKTTKKAYVTEFSNKTRRFCFANARTFDAQMSRLKLWFMLLLLKKYNGNVEYGFVFKKICISDKSLSHKDRQIAIALNKCKDRIADNFTRAYEALNECECYDGKARSMLNRYFLNYVKYFEEGHAKYKHSKSRAQKICLDISSFSSRGSIRKAIISLRRNIDLIERKCLGDIDEFMTKLIPVCW